jgi:putative nucleotidyltransferase with HDIG domain
VATRIQKILNDEHCTADKVAHAVNLEPVIAGRLMEIANSAAYKCSGKAITNIRDAVCRIGFDMVRNTTIVIAARQLILAPEQRMLRAPLKRLWQHSVEVASIAYMIAKQAPRVNPDEAMLAGLMHDIGKFYILSRANSYPELFNNEQELEELIQEWHTGVGRAILEDWHLPESVAIAADEHEIVDRAPDEALDVTDVVFVANLLAHLREGKIYEDVKLDTLPVWHKLELDLEAGLELLQKSGMHLAEMKRIMGA